jgi:HEPN domain-containing protein
MRRDESHYPKDWFRIGDKELERAKNLFNIGDLEGAGFNIQQAVEKYLKGYLLSKGWELRRIHDIEILLNEVIIHNPFFEKFRIACQKMTDYYVEERYPLMTASELTNEDIRESLTAADSIIEKIKELVE